MPQNNEQANDLDPLNVGELISLPEAAKTSGLSHSHLKIMAGRGRLSAKKLGRDWFTTIAAIEQYKRSRHRGKRTDLDK